MAAPHVQLLGIRELRTALRAVDKDLVREVSVALKAGAAIAADAAKPRARHKSGQLASSIRPGASGTKAYIKSGLVYAGPQEFGGRVGINHSVRIKPSLAMTHAVEDSVPEIVDKIGDELDALATRNGF